MTTLATCPVFRVHLNVEITTGSLDVLNGAFLSASTRGQGDAGNVIINAQDSVSFVGTSADGGFFSGAFSEVEATGVGQGGNVEITTGSLDVQDDAELTASTFGQGDAGNVIINARNNVSFINGDAFSTVEATGVGQGGNVEITTGSLDVQDGAQLIASTRGQGDAGNVTVTATDSINLRNNSSINNRVQRGATGNSQRITLDTPNLSLSGDSTISAATNGNGSAGDIRIQNADTVSLNDSSISTQVLRNAVVPNNSNNPNSNRQQTRRRNNANQGNITIEAERLNLDNSAITASTNGQGQAGNITIIAVQQLQSTGGNIRTNANRSAGGNIQIRGGDINLTQGSNIRTDVSRGNGNGGDITVNADAVRLQDDSDIQTRVGTEGSGDGGDIDITANSVIAFDDSDIITESPQTGGDITLNTTVFFGAGYQPDSASGNADDNGRVDLDASGSVSSGSIQTPDTSFIQNSLADLTASGIDTENLLANSCIARSENGGTFLITGTGGLRPDRPGSAPVSPYPTDSVRATTEAGWQPGDPIIEPQGVYRLPNGELVMMHDCQQAP